MVSVQSSTVPQHRGGSADLMLAGSEQDDRVFERGAHQIDVEKHLGGLDRDPEIGDELLAFFGHRNEELFLPQSGVRDRGWRICLPGGLNLLLDTGSVLTPELREFQWCTLKVVDVRRGRYATYALIQIVRFEDGAWVEPRKLRFGGKTTERLAVAM